MTDKAMRPVPPPRYIPDLEERGGWLKPTAPPAPQATAPLGPFAPPSGQTPSDSTPRS